MTVSRRGFAIGTVAAAAMLAAATGGYRRFLGPWYPPTPYDDLLHQIVDRRPAAILGHVRLKSMFDFNVEKFAAELRRPGFALAQRARGDAAAGRVAEVGGWIVPQTVLAYAMVAASV